MGDVGLQLLYALLAEIVDLEYAESAPWELGAWGGAGEEVAVGVELVCVLGVAERVLYACFEYAGIGLVEVLAGGGCDGGGGVCGVGCCVGGLVCVEVRAEYLGGGVGMCAHDEEQFFAFAFDADDVYLGDVA